MYFLAKGVNKKNLKQNEYAFIIRIRYKEQKIESHRLANLFG